MYKGTYERWEGKEFYEQFRTAPLKAGDYIAVSKDVSRAVDYLLARPDVDSNRLVYFGLSRSAIRGPATLVTDRRFKATVLLAGGYTRMFRKRSELQEYQFTPHVQTPVLMIPGAGDTVLPLESSQIPFFEDLGSENKKHVLLPAGHDPPSEDVFREMTAWLEQIFSHSETETR